MWKIMKYIISTIVNWPLYVALKIMADFLNDKYAQMWYEDAANFPNRNFFQLLAERPYYRTVLFYRLKIIGSIFRHFYPTYTHFNLP